MRPREADTALFPFTLSSQDPVFKITDGLELELQLSRGTSAGGTTVELLRGRREASTIREA